MAEYISISEVKNLLAECPICTEHFDDLTRIPRRMPCCVQSICQPCLEIVSRGRRLTCPMCRHHHYLPGGIKSLPKEVIVLRMLEHIKIQKGIMPPCTDCPDNETASSRCEDCGTYLCQECTRAHFRHVTSRHHKVISLKEMKDRPVESFHRQHQCKDHNQPQQFYCNTCEKIVCVGCTVVEHRGGKGHDIVTIDEAHAKMTASVKHNVKQLEEKSHMLQANVKSLTKKVDDFETSGNAAGQLINTSFDRLIDEIQKRRTNVLSGLEKDTSKHVRENRTNLESTKALLAKITSATDYIKLMQDKADQVENLQLMNTSNKTLGDMVKEASTIGEYSDREGLVFVPVRFQHLYSILQQTGLVRSVRFSMTNGLSLYSVDNTTADTNISQRWPEDNFLEVQTRQFPALLECPYLEFDRSTATDTLSFPADGVVSNLKPTVPPLDTRCRFQIARYALVSRQLTVTTETRFAFGVKIDFTMKRNIPRRNSMFEIGLQISPSDSRFIPRDCHLLVMISGYDHLCLVIRKKEDEWGDAVPVALNRPGETGHLNYCFVFDGKKKKFYIVSQDTGKVVKSVPLDKDMLGKPLWLRVHIEDPDLLSLTTELFSGKNFELTPKLQGIIQRLMSE